MSGEREIGWGREKIYLFGVLSIRLRGFEGFSEGLPFYASMCSLGAELN